MNKSISVNVEIDSFDIADSCNYHEAMNLIKVIDERQQSYEFTEEVALMLLEECLKCLQGEEQDIKTFKAVVGKLFKKYE